MHDDDDEDGAEDVPISGFPRPEGREGKEKTKKGRAQAHTPGGGRGGFFMQISVGGA